MFGGVFDAASIDKKIAEKEAFTASPGFWDDSEKAGVVMNEIKRLKNRVEPWRALLKKQDDLEAMFELAEESGGADEEAEVEQMYEETKAEFEKLNILNLLSGEVDPNDAFLSIHAGAG